MVLVVVVVVASFLVVPVRAKEETIWIVEGFVRHDVESHFVGVPSILAVHSFLVRWLLVAPLLITSSVALVVWLGPVRPVYGRSVGLISAWQR